MTSNEKLAFDAAKEIVVSKVSNMGNIYANAETGANAAEYFKAIYEYLLTIVGEN
ncbi:MAG: hypothetical protein RR576_11795 [Oscillospiraceae bacterium]